MTENESECLRRQVEELKAELARLKQDGNEAVYRSLFEDNHAVMLLIDPETAAIRDANSTACTYYGWSREELTQFRIDEINTLSREDVFAQMELARSEQRRNFFFKHRRADGSIRDVEVYSGPLTVKGQTLLYSIVHDVTDRVLAQQQLTESERRLSTLMANLPGMAYRCLNDDFWTMKFVSDGCFALTGFPPNHLLESRRTNYAELIHPEDRPAVRERVQYGLDRRAQFNMTYRIRCADGNEKWVMEIGQGVFTDSGELLAIEGFITDISERIKAEREKSKLENQNRQLQKAESLGRMAGAIAHRFNNLLGVVLGNLEMALNAHEPGTGAIENLTEAMQAARRAAEVSGLMLTYLGQTRSRADAIDFAETCRRNMQMLRDAMPKEVLLEPDFPPQGPIIKAGAHQIQQILANLCTNAWEAIGSSRGTIRLTIKVVSAEDIPSVQRFPLDWHPIETSYACLEVADSGCGIASKDIEKLFDPFFSSKFTGRGLGLPVVLGVVKSYRGAVAVESKPGKGSAFRVYLPVESDAAPLQMNRVGKVFSVEDGGTVLLVEDDDMLRKLTHSVLKSLGFAVIAASDGAEAVEIFRNRQEEIRLVLCDLTMPRMDGWATLEAMRQLSPEIPIILTSGFDETEVMDGDHVTLPDAFLSKPYERQELIDAIDQVLSAVDRQMFTPRPRSQ
ncbi:MAG: PAS domain S-box protein [Desulfobacterales bacterium]|jgi:PAS domain S-box-containing protein|nr:PAS domain S-box protein [Desulfobacterales bacterium]